MANIKIYLEKGEEQHDAEELLFKALDLHRSGDAHKETFADPAIADLFNELAKEHPQMWALMLSEINEILDEEFTT